VFCLGIDGFFTFLSFRETLAMNYERSHVLRILLCLAAVGVLCIPAYSATVYWNASPTGDWNTPGNWSTTTVPVAGDIPVINNGAEATISANIPGLSYGTPYGTVRIGSSTAVSSGDGTLTTSGGTSTGTRFYSSGPIVVGYEGTDATAAVTGKITVIDAFRFTIANAAATDDDLPVGQADDLIIGMTGNGFASTGTFEQQAGNVNVGASVRIGLDGASSGTYTMSGGVLNTRYNTVHTDPYFCSVILGDAGTATGTMNISGTAQINIADSGAFWVNNGSSGTSTVYQTGGTVSLLGAPGATVDTAGGTNKVIIGVGNGAGVYNLSGGTLSCPGNGVFLAWYGSTTVGTFNLNAGGTLSTRSVMAGSYWGGGTGNFYFKGGTLQATADNTQFLGKSNTAATTVFNAYVSNGGGAVIDTAGYNVGIAVDLTHDPALDVTTPTADDGLTKVGAGTLSLNGASGSDFNGPINVNVGTLRVNTILAGGGAITVASGAAIGGTGNILTSTVTINSGGAISGGSAATPGTLTLGNLTLNASTVGNTTQLNARLGSAVSNPYDQLSVGGGLSFGNITVAVDPYQASIGSGTYTLVNYSTLVSGGVGNLSLAMGGGYAGLDLNTIRQTFTFDMSTAGQLNLVVAGTRGDLTWTNGSGNTNWDVGSQSVPAQGSVNWTNANTPMGASKFYNADDVTFVSTGGPWNVNLTDNVLPAKITMNLGGGTLSLGTKNLITGDWTADNSSVNTGSGNLSASTLAMTGSSSLSSGTGSLSIGDLSLTASNYIAGSGTQNVGNLTLVSGAVSGGTVNLAGGADLQSGTISATVAGNSGINKTTAGTVTLSGSVSANSIVTYGGTLVLGSTSVSNIPGWFTISGDIGTRSSLTINSGASLTTGLWVGGGADPATPGIAVVNSAGNIVTNSGFGVGSDGNGYMYQTAGTIDVNAGMWVGQNASGQWASYGSYKMTGGTINVNGGNPLSVANCGTGLLDIQDAAINMSDGSALNTNPWSQYGKNDGSSTGMIIQRSNADITLGATSGSDMFWYNVVLIGGNNGTGIYNQLGSKLSATGNGLGLSWAGIVAAKSVGIYNLCTGAELITSNIHSGSTTGDPANTASYFNFHGGTLTASRDNSNFIYNTVGGSYTANPNGITAATVYKEGAVINTEYASVGHNITIATALVKPAGQGVSSITVGGGGGAGYLGAPIITISDTTGSGVGATAIANMVSDGAGGLKIGSITITNPGTGFSGSSTPTITITGGDATTAASLTAVLADNDATGGLTKQGLGTLTLTGNLTYGGTTDIQAGKLQINTAVVSLAAITGNGELGVGASTALTATSVEVGTLTLGTGSVLTIAAIPGGPSAGGSISPVPEPSTITLLALAGIGLVIAAWRKRR
jgi:fibronectin-binding autotransporter adhesin